MKLSKRLSLLALALILLSMPSAIAQDISAGEIEFDDLANMGYYGSTVKESKYRTVSGSPYINESWNIGRITLANGKQTVKTPLRFNSLENHIEFMQEGQKLMIPTEKVLGFYYLEGDTRIVFERGLNHRSENITPETFVQTLYKGDHIFFVHYNTRKTEGQQASYGSGEYRDRIRTYTNYFVQLPNGELKKLKKLKEKDVLKAFDSKKDALKAYAKQNKLSFKKEQDVAKIIKYADSL